VKKLTPQDLLSLEQYSRERKEFRTRIIAHKKARQLGVGPNTTWCFAPRGSSNPKASPMNWVPTTH
jgi:hypothetical protein